MNTKLFVGNVSYTTTENDLEDLFSTAGPVAHVNLVTDRATGKPRGFAFVTMSSPEGVEAAIRDLNGKDLNGRGISVAEARPREERPERSFSGGRDRYSR